MEPNKELFEKIIKHQRRCSSSVFADFRLKDTHFGLKLPMFTQNYLF